MLDTALFLTVHDLKEGHLLGKTKESNYNPKIKNKIEELIRLNVTTGNAGPSKKLAINKSMKTH